MAWVRVKADYHRGPYAQGWDMDRVGCDGSISRIVMKDLGYC